MIKKLLVLLLLSSTVLADPIPTFYCRRICFPNAIDMHLDKDRVITIFYITNDGVYHDVEGRLKEITEDRVKIEQTVDLYMLGNVYHLPITASVAIKNIEFVLLKGTYNDNY